MSGVKSVQESLAEQHVQLPRRRSLSEDAADTLRKLILLEKLPPGLPVPERDLAEELGISRTPLKQALSILEIEGLIEYSSTRRPRVADPSLESIAKNLAVLAALEALAGEVACREATKRDIRDILRLDLRMRKIPLAAPPLKFFDLDMAFHARIVEAARNEPLVETHRRINARLWRARFMSSRQTKRRANTLAEHKSICEALSVRDPVQTSAVLRRHLQSTVVNIADVRKEKLPAGMGLDSDAAKV